MEQIKTFQVADNVVELENQVNKWLVEKEGKIAIRERLQSSSGHISQYVTISIFYEEQPIVDKLK